MDRKLIPTNTEILLEKVFEFFGQIVVGGLRIGRESRGILGILLCVEDAKVP